MIEWGMPFRRRPGLLVFSEDEQRMLERHRKSRTEDKRGTVRAAILLDSFAGMSDQAIARAQRVNRNTVMRCIQKWLRFGVQGTKSASDAAYSCHWPETSFLDFKSWYRASVVRLRERAEN